MGKCPPDRARMRTKGPSGETWRAGKRAEARRDPGGSACGLVPIARRVCARHCRAQTDPHRRIRGTRRKPATEMTCPRCMYYLLCSSDKHGDRVSPGYAGESEPSKLTNHRNPSHPYTAIVEAAGDRILLDGADGARKNLFALQIRAGSRFFAFAPFSATVNLMARYRYARNIAMNSARQSGRPSCVDLH